MKIVRFAAFCCAWFAGSQAFAADTSALLSERPQEAASATQFNAGMSTIQPSVDMSYGVLAAAANAAADRFSGPRSGTTKIGCSPAQVGAPSAQVGMPQSCANFDWHITAARNGTITAKRDGAGVAMAIPVKFTGNGSVSGDLAQSLNIGNKTFGGTFVVTISGVLHPDKSFCPKLDQAVTHFAWGTPPEVNLVGKTCLGIANGPKICFGPWNVPVGAMLTDQINRSLAAQVDAINGKIACDDVRNDLKQVWKSWSLPVTLANAPTFYVNVEPKSLSVPGVVANDDSVTLTARLDVSTSVSTDRPPTQAPVALPENTPLPAQGGRFNLHVPLAIPYALMANVPTAIVGQPLKAGRAAITPTGIEFFPSNGKLAIGVTFRADSPAKLSNKTGTIWYLATPVVADDGHMIRLSNLAMTAKKGSDLWLLSGAIAALPKKIADSYSYDMGPLVHDAQAKLDQALADPKNTNGVDIKVTNDDLKLGRTALLGNVFVVEGVFDADVNVALQTPHA